MAKKQTWFEKKIKYIEECNPKPENESRKNMFLKQFKENGFSDADTWSMDTSISQYIVPMLKRFKQLTNGYPQGETEKTWKKKIDIMIKGFTLIADGEQYCCNDKKKMKQMEDGLDLFRKHFFSLWW